jgi:gas vesicle protein
MNSSVSKLLLSMVGFSAGVAAGVLLAPRSGKESRRWMQQQGREARDWVEHRGGRLLKDSETRLQDIKAGVKEMLPDLYEATEELLLKEEELEGMA